MEKALVFNIQKFSIQDGPGIRTTVFVKGCPLRCRWCHNPESWSTQAELLYSAEKCIGCGMCVERCPEQCHLMTPDGHVFERARCIACGKCAQGCYSDALSLCGTLQTTDEVLAEVMKDKAFYDNSGGGMTVSGGEPMMHVEFTLELLQKAKSAGLHTCIETCGFAPWEQFERVRPFIDLFLYDIKSVNAAQHRELTKQDNQLILDNLRKLDNSGAQIRLRCPLIPGLNDKDSDLEAIAALANSLKNVQFVEVEPYHPLGCSKAKRLGKNDFFELPFTEQAVWEKWVAFLSAHTTVPVRKS